MASAPLIVSVSGVRGIVGASMSPEVATRYASAFGAFVRETSEEDHPVICVGRDSRPSGEALVSAATEGLASAGCRAIDLGVVATPTVGVMIGHHRAAGGMVVTASHNPGQWNGLKLLNRDGAAPPLEEVERIVLMFRADHGARMNGSSAEVDSTSDNSANDVHVKRVLRCIDVEAIRAAKLKVVLDSINGAGCVAGRMLLESLGCEVVHINNEPTGQFAHTPEPLEENLHELAERTLIENAACGFAQDPDADRLAVIDETGSYIGEEYTLVLAAKRVLERRGPGVMAANLSTSRMIDDLAAMHPGASVIRTAVGEAHVAAAMRRYNAIIGGEGNGGVILPEVTWVRDSLSAMALVLELIAVEKRPLSAIVDEPPRYAMIKEKIDLAEGGREEIDAAIERARNAFADQRIDVTDGIRIDFTSPEIGWVHLRSSNTEPIIRIIAEAKTADAAKGFVNLVANRALGFTIV